MNFQTKVILGTVASVPAVWVVGTGLGVCAYQIEELIKSKKKPTTPTQNLGPKVEKIKNPVRRHNVNKKFTDITDKY